MRILLATAGALALAAAPLRLAAAEPAQPIEPGPGTAESRAMAGVFLGGTYLSGELELGNSVFSDQVPESGPLVGLFGAYLVLPSSAPRSWLRPRLWAELEGALTLSSTAGAPQSRRSSYFAPVIGWRVHLLLSLGKDGPLQPFVLAGAGGATMVSSSPFTSSTDTDAALHWGLGASYALTSRYGLRGELRHEILPGRAERAASALALHIGLYVAFAKSHLPAAAARPRARVEAGGDISAAARPGRARPADRDGDGIGDAEDACPDQDELYNAIDDGDGCPEVDADEDEVVGSRDQCPDAAEDADGFQDEDGCLDSDDDGDGMADLADGCPLEAETRNGFQDGDGCADIVPEELARWTGVIADLAFRPRSAKVPSRAYRTLDRLAAVLMEHPSVRLRLSGHTDERESPAESVALSLRRAEAVKAYLVRKGVDAGRLDAVGYGAERAIAGSETGSGRRTNRRIEVELLPGPAPAGGGP